MIRIAITRDGELLDAITFDAADVSAHEGGKGVVHRNVMAARATASGTASHMLPASSPRAAIL
jgi:hypothetical protein